MTNVVVFHNILGIRAGLIELAGQLEALGHTVHLPNLYDDEQIFDDYDAAGSYLESLGGYPEWLRRTRVAVDRLPANVVYLGFSSGAASAEYVAVTRPGAKGTILMGTVWPLEVLADFDDQRVLTDWPATVPVQAHFATGNPFHDPQQLEAFTNQVKLGGAEFASFEYPDHAALQADQAGEYDAPTQLAFRHIQAALAAADAR